MGLTSIAFILVLVRLEHILPYRLDWSMRGDREIRRDIGHAVLYTAIGGNAAQIVYLDGFASVLSRLGLASGLGLWPENSPLVVQVLTVVLLGDMLAYWYHRLTHTVPWLWPLHAVHHTPVRLHTLKGARHHLCYFLGRGLIVWVPLLLVGVPPGLVVWQFVAVVLTGALAHANIAFRIPVFVHRIFVTPEFHRLHHSIDRCQAGQLQLCNGVPNVGHDFRHAHGSDGG
jgi:sterol desaturase/sphingolipid hydroxylase (fatty acid hydroxylase superfamily)